MALVSGPIGEALASRDFAAHLWAGVESLIVAQYRVMTPSSGSGVLQASSPILDREGALSTLPWCEQVDWKEQEAVASTSALLPSHRSCRQPVRVPLSL